MIMKDGIDELLQKIMSEIVVTEDLPTKEPTFGEALLKTLAEATNPDTGEVGYKIDETNRAVIDELITWGNEGFQQNIVLFGEAGTGKTWLAKCLAKASRGMIHYQSMSRLKYEVEMSDVVFGMWRAPHPGSIDGRLCVRCVDEFCDEEEINKFGTRVLIGKEIILGHYENKYPLMIVTNYTGKRFSERYGPHTADRLKTFRGLELRGRSRR